MQSFFLAEFSFLFFSSSKDKQKREDVRESEIDRQDRVRIETE